MSTTHAKCNNNNNNSNDVDVYSAVIVTQFVTIVRFPKADSTQLFAKSRFWANIYYVVMHIHDSVQSSRDQRPGVDGTRWWSVERWRWRTATTRRCRPCGQGCDPDASRCPRRCRCSARYPAGELEALAECCPSSCTNSHDWSHPMSPPANTADHG